MLTQTVSLYESGSVGGPDGLKCATGCSRSRHLSGPRQRPDWAYLRLCSGRIAPAEDSTRHVDTQPTMLLLRILKVTGLTSAYFSSSAFYLFQGRQGSPASIQK